MREATGIGTASKIHHRAVQMAMAKVRAADSSKPPIDLPIQPINRAISGATHSKEFPKSVDP